MSPFCRGSSLRGSYLGLPVSVLVQTAIAAAPLEHQESYAADDASAALHIGHGPLEFFFLDKGYEPFFLPRTQPRLKFAG